MWILSPAVTLVTCRSNVDKLVKLSELDVPISKASRRSGASGAADAVLSTTRVRAALSEDTLPAESVTKYVKL